MNVSGFLNRPVKKDDGPPECFGSLWNQNAPECAGGPDASFIPKPGEPTAGYDNNTGSRVRRQCDWYQSCGARCAAKANANGTLIPAQQVVRPQTPPAQQQVQQQMPPPATFGQWLQRTNQAHQAAQQQRPPAQQVQVPPQYFQQQQQPFIGGVVQPATTWQLNYAMPSYLSEPEIRHPGESIWAVLLREVLRAMGKSLGHSVSHFFDARSLKEK